ncbi:hypothetical protein GCM10023174_23980 [Chelativorans composti]|jgi:fatty acid desaturase|uniref:DUF3329 domain-containing protein n=1 Tax=Chelativorans composti TaxID=768533 RepID=A0ABW5DJQ6_9HYPH
MRILETEHPFFRPLWVRAAIVLVAFAWAAFEFSYGEVVWALVFGAIGSYCCWVLLISYRKPEGKDGQNG